MDFDYVNRESLVHALRRARPLAAHARPALLTFLRARGAIGRGSPRLIVVDIFDAGEAGGLMCRFTIAGETNGAAFVAPLTQFALDRRHPAGQRLAQHRRQAPRPGAA